MSEATRKDKIKAKITEYFNARENIFYNANNKEEVQKYNAEKHSKANEMADLLNQREFDIIIPKFQRIVTDEIEGCSSAKMLVYLNTGAKKYLECLGKQKEVVFELIDGTVRDSVVIFDDGSNIFVNYDL